MGSTLVFVQVWEPCQIKIIEEHEFIKKGKCTSQQMDRKATRIMNVPYSHCLFTSIWSKWYKAHVCSYIGDMEVCHTALTFKNFEETTDIRSDVDLTEYKS